MWFRRVRPTVVLGKFWVELKEPGRTWYDSTFARSSGLLEIFVVTPVKAALFGANTVCAEVPSCARTLWPVVVLLSEVTAVTREVRPKVESCWARPVRKVKF